MKNYKFIRRNFFSGPHLLGVIFIAVGLFALVSPAIFTSGSSLEKSFYLGTTAVILGTLIVSSYGGTEIDFHKNRVKDYFSILGYRFGEWAALPAIKRISAISIDYQATNTPNGISPTWSGTVTDHKVFLYSENVTPILSFVFSNKKRAIEAAKLLAFNLDAVCEFREV